MDTATTGSAAAPKNTSPAELTSILTQVQTLQSEREKLAAELEETKSNLAKLQEGKRVAMPENELVKTSARPVP